MKISFNKETPLVYYSNYNERMDHYWDFLFKDNTGITIMTDRYGKTQIAEPFNRIKEARFRPEGYVKKHFFDLVQIPENKFKAVEMSEIPKEVIDMAKTLYEDIF